MVHADGSRVEVAILPHPWAYLTLLVRFVGHLLVLLEDGLARVVMAVIL